MGQVPNQNYYDNSALAAFPNDEGYFYGYGSIPFVPFRKFSPRMAERMKSNSGGDTREKLDAIIFPPGISFRFQFEKTPSENFLHQWYFPSYTDQMGSKQEQITFADYRTFTTDADKTYIIKKGHCDVQSVALQAYICYDFFT